jgi:hypothetical protein
MKIATPLIICLLFAGASGCKDSGHNASVNSANNSSELSKQSRCDSVATHITLQEGDSLYSVEIKTHSLFSNAVKYPSPCVTKQEVVFKFNDSSVLVEEAPQTDRLIDSNSRCSFLKFPITGIAVDRIKEQNVYILYLFAANGEPEYNFYYSHAGQVLFYEKCDKQGCIIKCYGFDERTAKQYCDDNYRTLNMQEIKGLCQ